jgi:nitrogen fixation protein FixH
MKGSCEEFREVWARPEVSTNKSRRAVRLFGWHLLLVDVHNLFGLVITFIL